MLTIVALGSLLLQEPQDREEWQTTRVQAVLKDLSDFARQVNSGTRTLARAFGKEGQPQGMMTELQALVHTYPCVGSKVLEFLRAKDQPLMARATALLTLAVPRKTEVAKWVAIFLSEPSDIKLAKAVIWCYATDAERGWKGLLSTLGLVDPTPGWGITQGDSGVVGLLRTSSPVSAPDHVDMRPVLEAVVGLLKRRESAIMEWQAFKLAWRLSERKEANPEHRKTVRDLMIRSYVEADEGFEAALGYLWGQCNPRRPPDPDTLARGFPKLDARHQLLVLTAIAARVPESILKSPYREGLDKAVELMSRRPAESGVDLGTHYYLMRALRIHADEALVKRLLENPTETLRQRLELVR